MLWELEIKEGQLSVQDVIDFFADLLKKIFAFIAGDQGWVEEEAAAE